MASSKKPATSWRDTLAIHPAADLFPLMSADELKALGKDIKANGLRSAIMLWRADDKASPVLLDGRNRLDAMEAVGLAPKLNLRMPPPLLDLAEDLPTMRCARDSVPPLRLAVLRDLAANDLDDCRVADVAKRLEKPWMTIDRTLQALHVLQLLKCVNVDKTRKQTGEEEDSDERKTVRHYCLASGVSLDVLTPSNPSPEK